MLCAMSPKGAHGVMDGRVQNFWTAMILPKGDRHKPDRIWRSIPELDKLVITSQRQLVVQINATMIDGVPVKQNHYIRFMREAVNPYDIDVMYLRGVW